MLKSFFVFALIALSIKAKPYLLELSNTQLNQSRTSNLSTNDHKNIYEIQLAEEDLLEDKQLYILFESTNPDMVLSVLSEQKSRSTKVESLIDLTTFSGDIGLVMSDTFFNGRLNFFKQSGSLRLAVSNKSNTGDLDYTLKVQIGTVMQASMGRIYSTRVDAMVEKIKINLFYDGSKFKDLRKLRFQLTSVKQKSNYSLDAVLNYKSNSFKLNNVFQKSVGGILSKPDLPVCEDVMCNYELEVKLKHVKLLNIESFMIEKIESLSINHYEEYYDKVYSPNTSTTYELKYDPGMKEMDVSISLIPVAGTSGLYANPQTLPLDLEKYTWKEEGKLAKRITIKWEELVEMKADESSIFITVFMSEPGEYLIKIDAHDQGYKGRLNSGIIEAGFVKYEEIGNYIYLFEVFENQDITFDLRLNIFSGDADLYVKQCETFMDCKIEDSNLKNEKTLKVENTQNIKNIKHSFTCKYKKRHSSSICQFVIGVKGKENHGTHYDLSLHESQFHRLIIPGHSVPINIYKDEIVYLKFSFPHQSDKNNKLLLSIEPIWGDFVVMMSKSQQFPSESDNELKKDFKSSNVGLFNSMKNIQLKASDFKDGTIQGVYYIAIKANTSCALNAKFYEQKDSETTIHTLTAGNQVRGEITKKTEIVYYTMKLSLDSSKASSVSVNLTPLKGKFTMFASRTGKMPTKENHELISENNHLEFLYKEYNESKEEYILGVQALCDGECDKELLFQYLLNFTYANKPLMLNPGIISTYTIQNSNLFMIQILDEMFDLLILKSIVDGHNLSLCAIFTSSEIGVDGVKCDYEANERNVSINITENDLKENCKKFKNDQKPCFLQLSVKGTDNQKFSIGYTYNQNPFQVVKGTIVNGPALRGDKKINFIYHAEPEKAIGVFLNTKGCHLNVYSKLVDGNNYENDNVVVFPTENDHDKMNKSTHGHIHNIWYPESKVNNFGNSPEILITIESKHPKKNVDPYDPSHEFVLQTAFDSFEILRTQTHSEFLMPGKWNYFNFYNNGNSDGLRIYVSSSVSTSLEVLVSPNIHSRPPFTNKPIVSKKGIGSVDIELKTSDLKFDSHQTERSLKGHYTVAVKGANTSVMSIFWNNKDDLNYLELTPGEPSMMKLEKNRKFYFSFYAQEGDTEHSKDKGNVEIYIKSSVQANIYLLKTMENSLDAPSKSNHNWKSSIGHMGGVTALNIKSNDPEYCTECTYIGYIETKEEGNVSLIATIEHQNIPLLLTPGFNFPIMLEPDSSKKIRIFNPDSDIIDLIVSMLTGFIDVYISAEEDVSEKNNKETYSLEKNLDIHKFIVIAPFKYEIREAHDYYLLLKNNKTENASFTIALEKNSMKNPIDPGMTKFLHLAPGENNEYFYTPKEEEKTFEVELELRQVLIPKFTKQALELINDYLNVYHISDDGSRYMLKYTTKASHDNRVYIVFDISASNKGTFSIHLYNPVGSGVYLSVFLANGGYKLVHLNEYTNNMVKGTKPAIYEAYGAKDKLLFFDLRMCFGDVKVKFYQTDFDKLAAKEDSDYKTIKDSNSFVHYLKLEKQRMFLEIINEGTEISIFELNVFNEKDLEHNPYSEITQGNGGKVSVDIDGSTLHMTPLEITSTYSKNFKHVIEYTAYLSDDIKIMKYSKNCGKYKMSHVFDAPHILTFSKRIEFDTIEDIQKDKKMIEIPFKELRKNTKYYGVVIATIKLLPLEEGYISPVRSGKAYYDEFIFVTPKYEIPFNYVISVLVCFGFIMVLFCIVKSYVFGKINRINRGEILPNLVNYDDGIFGHNIMNMLEDDYFNEDNKEETTTEEQPDNKNELETVEEEKEENVDDGSEVELTETNDKDTPLDG